MGNSKLRRYEGAYYRTSSQTPSLTTLLLFTRSDGRKAEAFKVAIAIMLSLVIPAGIVLNDDGYAWWRWSVAMLTWVYLNGFIRWGFDAWLADRFWRAVDEKRILWVANAVPQVREGMSPEEVIQEVARSAALRRRVRQPQTLPQWEVAVLPVSPWQPSQA